MEVLLGAACERTDVVVLGDVLLPDRELLAQSINLCSVRRVLCLEALRPLQRSCRNTPRIVKYYYRVIFVKYLQATLTIRVRTPLDW